jgi:hypothetical protein
MGDRTAAGNKVHTFRFERPVETRNAVGEVASVSWVKIARRRGSIEQVGYNESQDQGQTSGQASYLIVVPSVPGLDGSSRIVWESRLGRILVVSSVVGDDADPEQTIQASEKKT